MRQSGSLLLRCLFSETDNPFIMFRRACMP
jgi:hypothetical protein